MRRALSLPSLLAMLLILGGLAACSALSPQDRQQMSQAQAGHNGTEQVSGLTHSAGAAPSPDHDSGPSPSRGAGPSPSHGAGPHH
jgi:hypothetical protein